MTFLSCFASKRRNYFSRLVQAGLILLLLFGIVSLVPIQSRVIGSVIVNRGEWLGRAANFKRKPHCWRLKVETYRHVITTVHRALVISINKHGVRQRRLYICRQFRHDYGHFRRRRKRGRTISRSCTGGWY